MINCQDIISAMHQIAPPQLAETWDNVGLLVGSPTSPVKKVLVCLDVSAANVDYAIAQDCQMLIAHHPLIFHALKALRTDQPTGALLKKICAHNLAIFAAHTNYDSADGGVNDVLCKMLCLHDVRPLVAHSPADACLEGLGRIGRLAEPLPTQAVLAQLKQLLPEAALRFVDGGQPLVRKLALCSGAGAEFIDCVKANGADLYLTGDVKYHEARHAEEIGLNVVDGGHFGTEYPAVAALAAALRRAFPAANAPEFIVDELAQSPFQLF